MQWNDHHKSSKHLYAIWWVKRRGSSVKVGKNEVEITRMYHDRLRIGRSIMMNKRGFFYAIVFDKQPFFSLF